MSNIKSTYITISFVDQDEKETFKVNKDIPFTEDYFPESIFSLYKEKIEKPPFCKPHRHIKVIVNHGLLFPKPTLKTFFDYYERYLRNELDYETFTELIDQHKQRMLENINPMGTFKEYKNDSMEKN